MDYKDVLKSARENLNGSCKVSKVCTEESYNEF